MALQLIDTTMGAGDSAKAGGDKINANMRQTDSRMGYTRPPRIAFAGNSQSDNTASMDITSIWFWAQVRNPRLYDYNNKRYNDTTGTVLPAGEHNLARSGNRSGPYTGYAGTPTSTGIGPDTNSPTVINGLKLVAPDILVIVDAITNDGASGTPTLNEPYNNVKAVIQAVAAPKTIVLSSPPRTGLGNRTFVHQHNTLLKYWGTIDPSVIVVDVAPVLADDATAYEPIGGASGSAVAVTSDGLHYGILGARNTVPLLERALDLAGVPLAKAMIATQADLYDATTQPFGNLADTRGTFAGTTGTHANGNSNGQVATGWVVTNYAPQVKVTASKSTLVVDGVPHIAQQFDFSTTATTVGVQEVYFSMSNGGFAQPGNIKVFLSMLAQIVNLAGCTGVALSLGSGAESYRMGSYSNGGTAAQLIPANLTETLHMVMPGTCALTAAGGCNVTFQIAFGPGLAAGALGTLKLAQCVVKPVPSAI